MGLKQRIAALGTKRIVITCVVGGVLCLPVTFALLMLLSVAWNECDIGGDPAARFSLVVVSWPLFLIHTAVFATVFTLLAGSSRSTFRIVGAGLAGLLTAILLAAILYAWMGVSTGPSIPDCPSNAPTWWPEWIPT
ncbi:hypothetical protein [Kribbella endophytica]